LRKTKFDLEAVEFLLNSEKDSAVSQQDKIKELRDQLFASQAEQRTLQVEKEEKEQAIVKLQKQVEQSQKEIDNLTKKGESDLAKAKQETKEKLTKELAQQSEHFKEQQDKLQGQLEEVKNKLTNSASKVDELNRKLKEVKKASENSLTDYQKTIISKDKDLAISQAELENLEKRYQKELNSAQENQT